MCHPGCVSVCLYPQSTERVSSPTVWQLLTDNRMFTVPPFVAYVQTGVYAKGSKFKTDCYVDVCLTYASTSMYVLVYTERKIKFPESGTTGVRVWGFPDFMSTSQADESSHLTNADSQSSWYLPSGVASGTCLTSLVTDFNGGKRWMGASSVSHHTATCLQLWLRYWTPGCSVRVSTLADSLLWRLGVAVVCRWILWGSPGLIRGHFDTEELYFESQSPLYPPALLFFASILCLKSGERSCQIKCVWFFLHWKKTPLSSFPLWEEVKRQRQDQLLRCLETGF